MSLHVPHLDAPKPADPRARCSRTDIRVLRGALERRLAGLAPAADPGDALVAAVRYALLAPGKRIRPVLVALATQELGGDAIDALDAGCALEMVHAASLVFDDLPAMDDAPWRRDQPSTHVVYGEDVAILAGVALLSRAYDTLASAAGLTAETRCRLVAILARAVGTGGLATGQYYDLRTGEHGDLGRLADANHLKTGMLFVAAVEMAAVIAGAPEPGLARMRTFAGHLGQAFQLLDDLADGAPASDATHEDAGRATLVSVLGRDEVHDRLDRHVAHALAELNPAGQLARLVTTMFARAAAGHVPAGESAAGTRSPEFADARPA